MCVYVCVRVCMYVCNIYIYLSLSHKCLDFEDLSVTKHLLHIVARCYVVHSVQVTHRHRGECEKRTKTALKRPFSPATLTSYYLAEKTSGNGISDRLRAGCGAARDSGLRHGARLPALCASADVRAWVRRGIAHNASAAAGERSAPLRRERIMRAGMRARAWVRWRVYPRKPHDLFYSQNPFIFPHLFTACE